MSVPPPIFQMMEMGLQDALQPAPYHTAGKCNSSYLYDLEPCCQFQSPLTPTHPWQELQLLLNCPITLKLFRKKPDPRIIFLGTL